MNVQLKKIIRKRRAGTFLVVQELGICLPMQGTRVGSLVWKIPHASGQLSLCTSTVEPEPWRPGSTPTRARVP